MTFIYKRRVRVVDLLLVGLAVGLLLVAVDVGAQGLVEEGSVFLSHSFGGGGIVLCVCFSFACAL